MFSSLTSTLLPISAWFASPAINDRVFDADFRHILSHHGLQLNPSCLPATTWMLRKPNAGKSIPDLSRITLQCPNLKGIQLTGAGVDSVLSNNLVPLSVPIARIVDPVMAQSMGTYILCAVLNLHRKTDDYLASAPTALRFIAYSLTRPKRTWNGVGVVACRRPSATGNGSSC